MKLMSDFKAEFERLDSFHIGWESTDDIPLDAEAISMELAFELKERLTRLTHPKSSYYVGIKIEKIHKEEINLKIGY